MSNVDIASTVAAAKAAVQAIPQVNVPATVVNPTQTAVAMPQKRQTASEFLQNARVTVDHFLKVKEFGLLIGANPSLIKSLDVTVKLSDVAYPLVVRFGNPAQYYKSFDGGATCANSRGTPWQRILEVAKASKNDMSTDPYDTADVVMRLNQDVVDSDGKKLASAGQYIGYTPPYTGVAEWSKFLKEVRETGLDPDNDTVRVKVGYERKTNKNGNVWGVVTFTLQPSTN